MRPAQAIALPLTFTLLLVAFGWLAAFPLATKPHAAMVLLASLLVWNATLHGGEGRGDRGKLSTGSGLANQIAS